MNATGTIIIIVVVVIVMALAIYLLTSPNGLVKMTTVSSVGTNNSLNTTTLPTTVYTLPTTVEMTTSCLSTSATAPILNGNFSTGTYFGWNTTGTGFGLHPNNTAALNSNQSYYAAPWNGLSGDYFATTYKPGLSNIQPGNLTSDQFQVVEPYLDFKLISPQDAELYITIMEDNKSVFVTHFNTFNSSNSESAPSNFVNASIPVAQFLCKNVSIRVVGDVVGTIATRNQYIAVGDFYQGNRSFTTQGIFINHTSNQ